MLAVQADGHEVQTVEGLGTASELDPVQEGFKQRARPPVRLLHAGDDDGRAGPARTRTPTRPRTRSGSALSGNLCRCTGYQNIVKAVLWAAAKERGEAPVAAGTDAVPDATADAPRDAAVDATQGA